MDEALTIILKRFHGAGMTVAREMRSLFHWAEQDRRDVEALLMEHYDACPVE